MEIEKPARNSVGFVFLMGEDKVQADSLLSSNMSPHMSPFFLNGFRFLNPFLSRAVGQITETLIRKYSPIRTQQIASWPKKYCCSSLKFPNPSVSQAWIMRKKLRTARPSAAKDRKNLPTSPQVI